MRIRHDESKITRDRHSMSMTIQTSVTHLLHALMIKNNGQSNGNECIVYFKTPIHDTLAVAHKCQNSLSIKTEKQL